MITVPYEVKKALRDGMLRKNYRFVVLNDDGTEDFTIDNDTLVSESVNIDERMCSGDTLKFGLCEGSSLEFQYFDHPNITGRRVQVFVDCEYALTPYEDVGLLDTGASGQQYRYDVTENGDYRIYIEPSEVDNVKTTSSVSVSHNGPTDYYDMEVKSDGHGEVVLLGCTTIDSIYLWAKTSKTAKAIVQIFRGNIYTIPMGFFDVKKCSRQASTGIIKATAYNKLQSEYLDAKANDEIIDIVSQGEEGNSTVSFYWILDKLLKDYSIEKYDTGVLYPDIDDEALDIDTSLESWGIAHNVQINELIFPLYQGGSPSFKYLHVCVFRLNMGGFQGFQQYYARFMVNAENGSYITESVYNLGAVPLRENYVFVYADGDLPPQEMSLNDFLINGGWETRRAEATSTYTLEQQKRFLGGLLEKDGSYILNLISDYTTDIHYISNNSNVGFYLPYRAVITYDTNSVSSSTDLKTYFRPFHHAVDWVYKSVELNIPEAAMQRITLEQAEGFGDVTLRDLQSAVYESACQFGQLSRITDLFSGVDLNHSRLYPADTLYPATDLYPGGAALSGAKSMYSKLWADEGNVHKWRNLIITYKGLDEEQNEVDYTLQRTVNADGTDDYNMSDNWLFRNLIWTAEQVGEYADAMVAKMQDVTWFPFEMWCAGLPYLETGDEIEIPLNGESYTSYVLQRQLKGIQNLQDTYINGTLDIF